MTASVLRVRAFPVLEGTRADASERRADIWSVTVDRNSTHSVRKSLATAAGTLKWHAAKNEGAANSSSRRWSIRRMCRAACHRCRVMRAETVARGGPTDDGDRGCRGWDGCHLSVLEEAEAPLSRSMRKRSLPVHGTDPWDQRHPRYRRSLLASVGPARAAASSRGFPRAGLASACVRVILRSSHSGWPFPSRQVLCSE